MKTNFDPNAAATKDSGIFGLPFSETESALVLLPVPWEVTTSYGGGTSQGPQAILQASKQIDLFDIDLGPFYEAGIALAAESVEVQQWNRIAKEQAFSVINAGGVINSDLLAIAQKVNQYSERLNQYVYDKTKQLLQKEKKVGIVGGDHSTPFGAIQAFLEKYPQMGILHFDAHADLRSAFEGFEYSHASIMHNVITKTNVQKLVQVGIRDFCQEEWDFIQANPQRIKTFFDLPLSEKKLQGVPWDKLCEEMISALPEEVYISFDIDGLDPRFCPHTGTPVPGGLSLEEAYYLIKKTAQSGRKIIGFDLNEVAPGTDSEWDANVAARLLFKLCGWVMV